MIGETLLGRYTVEARLGDGGMGAVYRAVDERGTPFAIKRMHGEIASESNLVARFEREAEAQAMLAHPNIAALHAVGTSADGGMFFVMEYVDGHDLGTEIGGCGRIEPRRAIALARQLLGALHHAHQFGLVHRDLKPENVLLAQTAAGEQIKIID